MRPLETGDIDMDKEEKMREVDPMTTPRAKSWQLYKDAPMPMVTIFKTLDVSPLCPPQGKRIQIQHADVLLHGAGGA